MAFKSRLPSEILIILFQDLCDQDLISCSRTCWAWNAAANPLLYKTVYISNHTMFQQFIESIADFQDHNKICVKGTIKRHQRLGELVQVVNIIVDYSYNDEIHNHFTRLSRLASETPNVHTSRFFPPIYCPEITSNPPFDWGILASQWPKLTSLTLCRPWNYCVEENDVININDVFDKLQHVDISSCELTLTYMLPSPPNMPHLKTFAVMISDPGDYNALRTILQTCQSTLRTLIIRFFGILRPSFDFEPGSIDLDDLLMGQKQLKAFGMTTGDSSLISITSFGDNLEHLGWSCHRTVDAIISNQSINEAMIKTKNLKSLFLDGTMSGHHVSLTLESNKSTLHTFFYQSSNAKALISVLLMNKVRLDNVTTLCFHCSDSANSDVRSLAQIFPNVEFLAVCRERYGHFRRRSRPARSRRPRLRRPGSSQTLQREQNVEKGAKWIETGALSHFRHVRAIDRITFLELIDPSSATFQQCDIFPSELWKAPLAMPMFV